MLIHPIDRERIISLMRRGASEFDLPEIDQLSAKLSRQPTSAELEGALATARTIEANPSRRPDPVAAAKTPFILTEGYHQMIGRLAAWKRRQEAAS